MLINKHIIGVGFRNSEHGKLNIETSPEVHDEIIYIYIYIKLVLVI